MRVLRFQKHDTGVTLIECVLAMALTAIILVPLTMGLTVSMKSWKSNNDYSELIEHTRLAMSRITTELRYATDLLQASENIGNAFLEFKTTTLIDANPDEEIIFFRRTAGNQIIYRQVDGHWPDGVELAGHADSAITQVQVESLIITPWTKDVNDLDSDNDYEELMPLGVAPYTIPPYSLDYAELVQLDLTMENKAQDRTVTISSMVKLRRM